MADLKWTPLHEMHLGLGARMVPFAGWDMPVQYAQGVMKEHLHTRALAGLFDVSHMGQVLLRPMQGMAALAAGFEALMPVDVAGLAEGRQRYGLFTNDAGGILDDLMFANRGDHMFVVVNAARTDHDIPHMARHLAGVAEVVPVADRALLALQGPAAESVLAAHAPGTAAMRFMDVGIFASAFGDLWVSRSGYTGEDGFEISVPAGRAEAFARALLESPAVAPIGLGARDSLRLEAGMPLYGHDADETTSPAEADLAWAIQKTRRSGGARPGGFPGAARILHELAEGPGRRRVGLRPEGRQPVREGTPLFATDGTPVGSVTSGGFAPSLGVPVSMGYVATSFTAPGTTLEAEVRGKRLPVTVSPLPFRPPSYKR
jgi:aminomethyltransferase